MCNEQDQMTSICFWATNENKLYLRSTEVRRRDVLVSWAAITKYHRLGYLAEIYFLSILEAQKSKTLMAWFHFVQALSFGV